jgi:hypothetical protein
MIQATRKNVCAIIPAFGEAGALAHRARCRPSFSSPSSGPNIKKEIEPRKFESASLVGGEFD